MIRFPFPHFEMHLAKVKDVGRCEFCDPIFTEEELAEEETYVVEWCTEFTTAKVFKACYQHLADIHATMQEGATTLKGA